MRQHACWDTLRHAAHVLRAQCWACRTESGERKEMRKKKAGFLNREFAAYGSVSRSGHFRVTMSSFSDNSARCAGWKRSGAAKQMRNESEHPHTASFSAIDLEKDGASARLPFLCREFPFKIDKKNFVCRPVSRPIGSGVTSDLFGFKAFF